MRFLLAEDDKNFGTVLKSELEEIGAVDLVNNGVDAVIRFLESSYTFVLLDVRMPRLNGIDTLKIIKAVDPRVPVITFSGEENDAPQRESRSVGALRFFKKPFAVEELKKCIRVYHQEIA